MNYKDALEYINESMKLGSVLGLDNVKELLKRLGNPQDKIPVIHVAGTNGKGSTIAFITSVLECAEYKVGRYISPTIFEYRERIQINGQNIQEKEFTNILERIIVIIENMIADGFGHPTAFEIETTAAFLHFLEQKCDVAVIETGMGGREDATNVMEQPVCSVITSISIDHTTFLGNTIEAIAYEKAGIIKNNCPIIVANQEQKILDIIMKVSNEKNGNVTITNTSEIKNYIFGIKSQSFCYTSSLGNSYQDIKIHMMGLYQINNCVNAIETIEILRKKGYNIKHDCILDGLRKAKWHGRFERIGNEPTFIIDGAHNVGAAIKLKETIELYCTNQKIVFIIGVLADKEYDEICKILMPYASEVYAIEPDNIRKLEATELSRCISKYNQNVVPADNSDIAVAKAIQSAGKEGVIVSFGSLFCIREVVDSYKRYNNKVGGYYDR